ncbi:MAG TPA: hypothetical protein VN249_02025 [Prolixibacteraceae bacterium]|nr:hypothetical protein [Prolixibacteraceae bacterium]
MTLKELMEYGDQMMNLHPDQKELIFIGVDDCLENNVDEDPRIEKMYDWITSICSQNIKVDSILLD